MRASLPLYRLEGLREAIAAFWVAIATEFAAEGVPGPFGSLDCDAPAVPVKIGEDVLFTQVCGYPLQTIYRGQASLLGAPVYDFEYCDGATHAGVFVVGAPASYRELADLHGCRFVYNSRHSNSGMNLPRLEISRLANGHPFFGSVEETGSQAGNLDRVVRGEADATCVDNVTLGYYRRCLPDRAAGLRVLAVTQSSPSIPYVTSSATRPQTTIAMRRALQRVGKAARWAQQRAALFLKDIAPIDGDVYTQLLDFERIAKERGYPELR